MSDWRAQYHDRPALVLGGTGFIGRWTAKYLVAAGARVTVTARDVEAARESLIEAGLPVDTGVALVHANVRSRDDVERLLDETQPAIVFNLAGYGVDRSERDEKESALVNHSLPQWLAESLATRHVRGDDVRLVHAGTVLEYGDVVGTIEEGVTPRPLVLYGRTKLAGTQAVCDVARASGLRAAVARLFTVYGPGEHEGRLVPALLHAALHGERVALSSGEQRRDFTYVEDVAEGLLRLGASAAAPGTVVNLATGHVRSVRAFVDEAVRVLPLDESRIAFGEMATRPDEIRHDAVSVDRLVEVTGWRPGTSVSEGLRRTTQESTRSLVSAKSPVVD